MDRRGPRAGASRTFFPKQPAATTKEAATTEPPPVPSADAEPAAEIREQDRLMPVANVSRIMRRALPYHAKISDDAKEVVQDCVSEFISFVTGEANERCHAEHRKTVTAEDIVWAMDRLGFDDYVAPLNAFVLRMRNDSEDGGGGPGGRVSDGRSGGSRRGPSLLEETTTTIRPAVFRRRPLPAAPPPQAFYAVRPVLPPPAASSAAAACFNGRYLMAGGGRGQQQRSVVPHYGGAAAFQGAGNNGAFYADEATSSNEAPAPAAPRAGSRRY